MLSLAHEPYPSRTLREPLLARRREPVVWSCGPAPEGLPEGALASYEKNGYFVLPKVFTVSQVHMLQREMQRLLEKYRGSPDVTVIREPDSDAVRSLFDLPTVSPVFRHLASHPRLLAFAQYVLASEVYLHQSRLNFKPGLAGKEFFWHSDFETWHMEDGMPAMRALSCSVLLTDNDEFNGPLLVIPGSHKTYVGCVGETPEDNYKSSLMNQTVGTPAAEALTLLADQAGGLASVKGPAGTVVFFDSNLLHSSAGNISPYPRANAFMVYNSMENQLGAPLHGLNPRPEHIARRGLIQPLRAL